MSEEADRMRKALQILHDYGKERRELDKDCDATFIERCAYCALHPYIEVPQDVA